MGRTNKVILNDITLIDLTEDTATEEDVVAGKTFHKANGDPATGTKNITLQTKSISPTTSIQNVECDKATYYGLSKVTVQPIKTEVGSATPTKDDQEIVPVESDAYFSKVIVDKIPEAYIIPAGTVPITTNGIHYVRDCESVNVQVAGGDVAEWDGTLTITEIAE